MRLVDAPLGPVIAVEAAVTPEASERFEQEILQVVSSLADEPPEGDFLTWDRRRFRAARLLTEAAPERAVARITSDLMRDGESRDVAEDIWEITPEAGGGCARSAIRESSGWVQTSEFAFHAEVSHACARSR